MKSIAKVFPALLLLSFLLSSCNSSKGYGCYYGTIEEQSTVKPHPESSTLYYVVLNKEIIACE